MLGNSLAGYIQAKSGRQLTFMIPGANLPISSIAKFKQILPTTKPTWWPPSSKPLSRTPAIHAVPECDAPRDHNA
jgi:hypothetical protein